MDRDPFSIAVDGIDDGALRAIAYRGREAINETFSYSIDIATTLPIAQLEDALFHRSACLRIGTGATPARMIRGRVHGVELHAHGGVVSVRQRVVRVELVPSLAFLKHSRNSRIFQDKRVPEIASALLDAWGIPHVWHLRQQRHPHGYCVQHEESDYDFMRRLLSAEGIFFYFATQGDAAAQAGGTMDVARRARGAIGLAQPSLSASGLDVNALTEMTTQLSGLLPGAADQGDCVLVLGDTPSAMSVAPSEAHTAPVEPVALHAGPEGSLETSGETVFDLRYSRRTVPREIRMRDYHAENERFDLHAVRRQDGDPLSALGDGQVLGVVEGALAAGGQAMPSELRSALTGLDQQAQQASQRALPGAAAEAGGGVRDAAEAILGAIEPQRGLHQRMSMYEFHPDLPLGGDVALQASVAIEQLQGGAVTLAAETNSRAVGVGYAIQIDNHESAAINGLYMVTELTTQETLGGDAPYRNQLVAIPGRSCRRPPRRPRPTRHVLDTAMVVGPPGSEIHTDSMGRVRVQFRWDRDRPAHEHSSCWMRVAQRWSGAGFGTHFLPRVGSEVLVSYLGGDIDRPVVIGAVPNSSNPVPLPLPAQQTTSGIITRSVPASEGFNALTFDDQRDRETIRIHAQRDFDTTVRHDRRATVHHDDRTTVHGTRRVEAQQHHHAVSSHDEIDVGGDRKQRIAGRDHLEVRGPSMAAYLGGRSEQVDGPSASTVRGEERSHVEGGVRRRIEGGRVVQVEGASLLQVGTAEQPQTHTQHVTGQSVVEAQQGIELISPEAITLRCGEATLSLTPSGIQLTAPNLRLEGETTESVGETFNVQAEDMIRLDADRVIALSSAASLTLTEEATVDGSRVRLKTPPDEAAGPEATREAPAPTTIHLVDQQGQPLAGQRFVIELEAGGRRWGVLDAEGRAVVPGLEGSASIMFPGLNDWEAG